eukprot:scaffold592343_cov20-Prasinocladus_malaysianus.AAC.1
MTGTKGLIKYDASLPCVEYFVAATICCPRCRQQSHNDATGTTRCVRNASPASIYDTALGPFDKG